MTRIVFWRLRKIWKLEFFNIKNINEKIKTENGAKISPICSSNLAPLKQDKVYFSNNSNYFSHKEYELPSNEDFEILKKEIQNVFDKNPQLNKYSNVLLKKENIIPAYKIMSDERLYNNPNFFSTSHLILSDTDTMEKASIKTALMDKILSDEKLFNNSKFMAFASMIIRNTNNEVQAQIANKIFSDENLFANENVLKKSVNIVLQTNKENRMEIADKILSNEKLYNNSELIDKAPDIISSVFNPYNREIANRILVNEQLCSDKNFVKKMPEIIQSVQTPESFLITEHLLLNEKLCTNSEFLKNVNNLIKTTNAANCASRVNVLEQAKESNALTPVQIAICLQKSSEISYKDIEALNNLIGLEETSKFSENEILIGGKFIYLINKNDIKELNFYQKQQMLRNLVSSNSDLFDISDEIRKYFPLLPSSQEEYCSLLPEIINSSGIETKKLEENKINLFYANLNELSTILKNMPENEFNGLIIEQEYPKEKFIEDVLMKLKKLPSSEIQKVYSCFGFELHPNIKSSCGYSITGYPSNFSDEKNLSGINDFETKNAIKSIQKNVIDFSQNNYIYCNNKEIENCLNSMVKELPEIRTMIGKIQAGQNGTKGAHDYDIMLHSLKVMKKIMHEPEFENLNNSDKKIMLTASLLHDITKKEGYTDKTHAQLGSFDAYLFSKKLNFSQDESIKLYTLIKMHEWLNKVNSSKNEKEFEKNIISTAYDLRWDNIFDMSLIFTHADLKSVKKNDSFHDSKNGAGRINYDGKIRSYGESADYCGNIISNYVKELQKSQPILPITKLPNNDKIKSKISMVKPDGRTNIKGLYLDENGIAVIKYNEVENWENLGFPKGSISRGIKTILNNGEEIDTGNIKFIAHGLDYPNQLAKFDAFSLIDSDALLSVSYMERPESKYRLYKPQGILLDVDTKYIHGGGNTDLVSGKEKNIQNFKDKCIINKEKEYERTYISNLIKNAANFSDNDYIEFLNKNKNKSLNEIEPKELQEKLIKAFANINSSALLGERAYNEMYISNPKRPVGVFAYNTNYYDKVGNPIKFLNKKETETFYDDKRSVYERTNFLREYALKNNIPFIVFGD